MTSLAVATISPRLQEVLSRDQKRMVRTISLPLMVLP